MICGALLIFNVVGLNRDDVPTVAAAHNPGSQLSGDARGGPILGNSELNTIYRKLVCAAFCLSTRHKAIRAILPPVRETNRRAGLAVPWLPQCPEQTIS
jgi:hypothetical protein